MKRNVQRFLLLLVIFSLFGSLGKLENVNSTPAQNVSDKMSNSQLSFFGRLAVGTSTNDYIAKIVANGSAPSKSTANIFVGDTLAIGNTSTGGSDKYVVKDIGNTVSIELTSPLVANNAWSTGYMIATRSAVHTIYFTPQSSVPGGIWQFLIKASNRTGENSMDGIPDQGGFDLGATTPSSGANGLGTRLKSTDVTCPFGTAGVGTTVVLSSGVGVGATGAYHVISCTLAAGANNGVGTSVNVTIGGSLTTGSQIINPAPASNHTEGRADNTADAYTFFIRHLYNDGTLIDADTTAGKIAVIESVRVSATVDPTITFYIDNTGVASGTKCGSPLSAGAVNTTATAVNFGPLNLSAFNDVAQRITCTTNAKNGYVVQVYEDGPLTNVNNILGTGATIPNANCDGGCSYTTAAAWTTDKTNSEFGYTLEAIGSAPIKFSNANGYKAFGVGNGNAQSIMERTSIPTGNDQAYICYRVTASNFQEAGNYENSITFLATATF
jgi:hypothetical protein